MTFDRYARAVAATAPWSEAPQPFALEWFEDVKPNLDAADFVEGVLIEGSMAVIYGESNSGKTFWTTDLALHIAAGKTWRGRDVKQGGVIYCALEGAHGIRNRVSAWRAHHGMDDARLPFAILPISLNLLDPDGDVRPLIATIKEAQRRIEMPVRFIVIDTLARAMAGGNENSPDDMGKLVINCDAIRAETGSCAGYIHHSGKDQAKGARGHSSLRAATDTEIEIVATEAGRSATVHKQREMPKGDVFGFDLEIVELGTNARGKPVTSCIVTEGNASVSDMAFKRVPKGAERALAILGDLIARAGKDGFPGVPEGAVSVPEDWWRDDFYGRAEPGASQDAKQKAFRRAAAALLDCRAIGMNRGRVWLV